MKVLLTGGSGFIAAHVLRDLLERGHSVVTTVRSQEKADKIRQAYPGHSASELDFAIVEDIAQEGAFDKVVVSNPPFKAVVHTASPFHFNVTDPKKDLLDPAIVGTTGILKAIKAHAPTVSSVVITSSIAAIIDPKKGMKYTYSEKDWNPVTMEEAVSDPSTAYRASKTFAESAAWDFVEKEKPNFTVSTINPPLVFGPVIHHLSSLSTLNTSNQRVRDLMTGTQKNGINPTGVFLWVDVRDVSLAHVLAMEKPKAAGKRFLTVSGHFCNAQIAEIIRKNFPAYADGLPSGKGLEKGKMPAEVMGFDNGRSKQVLGLEFRVLEESLVDTVKSLEGISG